MWRATFILGLIVLLGFIGLKGTITGYAVFNPTDVVQNAIDKRQEFVEVQLTPEKSKIFFIDYAGPVHATPRGTDCGPESNSYKPIKRNIGWKKFPVTYKVIGDFSLAVDEAFKTWDNEEHPFGTLFVPAENPDILVQWAPIDGPGGALAVTSLTYLLSGPILTATITFDSGDQWTIYERMSCEKQGNAFDVEDVAAHEIGHALGLAHTQKANDIALTMYPYASPGETLKRTLGTGDKRGLDALY